MWSQSAGAGQGLEVVAAEVAESGSAARSEGWDEGLTEVRFGK